MKFLFDVGIIGVYYTILNIIDMKSFETIPSKFIESETQESLSDLSQEISEKILIEKLQSIKSIKLNNSWRYELLNNHQFKIKPWWLIYKRSATWTEEEWKLSVQKMGLGHSPLLTNISYDSDWWKLSVNMYKWGLTLYRDELAQIFLCISDNKIYDRSKYPNLKKPFNLIVKKHSIR